MQTERKYKIDKYLEMARLTRNGDKKEEFIDSARYYLELSENEFESTQYLFTIPYVQSALTKEDLLGKTVGQVYKEYVETCQENNEPIKSKICFGKEVRQAFGLVATYKRLNKGQVARVYEESSKAINN
ncbi:hypothetical protein IWT25_02424 [Secundilactobacillus pentosiphilus]|uniref:Uncharacterized protein n=1 Tax=Secundilactobacillus pentosiphilus TaxID=1714682 RepID=A0A1Z5IZK6_9LACO|nr:hypothetical protein [Secundilactobacillus pentosiphilus]GAX07076.1 hypothetical protein IWT25_02424 [Secundilactobacillus pentosiphilus]